MPDASLDAAPRSSGDWSAAQSSLLVVASRTLRNWQFIQSVGGIALGTPRRGDDSRVLLPIDCDVSGRHITVRPTAYSSSLVCEAPLVRVEAQSVYLAIRTSLPGRYRSAQCPDADLGELPAGAYSVLYVDPDGSEHAIGSIEVSGAP